MSPDRSSAVIKVNGINIENNNMMNISIDNYDCSLNQSSDESIDDLFPGLQLCNKSENKSYEIDDNNEHNMLNTEGNKGINREIESIDDLFPGLQLYNKSENKSYEVDDILHSQYKDNNEDNNLKTEGIKDINCVTKNENISIIEDKTCSLMDDNDVFLGRISSRLLKPKSPEQVPIVQHKAYDIDNMNNDDSNLSLGHISQKLMGLKSPVHVPIVQFYKDYDNENLQNIDNDDSALSLGCMSQKLLGLKSPLIEVNRVSEYHPSMSPDPLSPPSSSSLHLSPPPPPYYPSPQPSQCLDDSSILSPIQRRLLRQSPPSLPIATPLITNDIVSQSPTNTCMNTKIIHTSPETPIIDKLHTRSRIDTCINTKIIPSPKTPVINKDTDVRTISTTPDVLSLPSCDKIFHRLLGMKSPSGVRNVDLTSPTPSPPVPSTIPVSSSRRDDTNTINTKVNVHNKFAQNNDNNHNFSQNMIDYNAHIEKKDVYSRNNEGVNRNNNKSLEITRNSKYDDSDFEGRSFMSQPLARRFVFKIFDICITCKCLSPFIHIYISVYMISFLNLIELYACVYVCMYTYLQ
jgi:hypothetical protein